MTRSHLIALSGLGFVPWLAVAVKDPRSRRPIMNWGRTGDAGDGLLSLDSDERQED